MCGSGKLTAPSGLGIYVDLSLVWDVENVSKPNIYAARDADVPAQREPG